MIARTLYDKLWESHTVHVEEDGTTLLYIDRHLVHEVTSPQAFEGMKLARRKPWRISANLAVADHNVPTTDRSAGIADPVSRLQIDTLDKNCAEYGIVEFKMNDARQGIVHVIVPEQGATLHGMTAVCGDSHTSTHGAFGYHRRPHDLVQHVDRSGSARRTGEGRRGDPGLSGRKAFHAARRVVGSCSGALAHAEERS